MNTQQWIGTAILVGFALFLAAWHLAPFRSRGKHHKPRGDR